MGMASPKAKRVPDSGYALSGNAYKKGGKVEKNKPSWKKKKHRGKFAKEDADSALITQY